MKFEIGTIYKVTVKDCCVEGSFTSKLISGGNFILVFENGVVLTEWNGCKFEVQS